MKARLDAVPARWVSQRMQQMTHRWNTPGGHFSTIKIIRNEEFQASMEPIFLIGWMTSRLQGCIYPHRQALGGHNKATTNTTRLRSESLALKPAEAWIGKNHERR